MAPWKRKFNRRDTRADGTIPQGAEPLRQRLCLECARIMAEEGVQDYQLAKRKACDHLGVGRRGLLPTNHEIEQSLSERLRLFDGAGLRRRLAERYALASETMHRLARFEPRLVGSLLRGNVTAHSPLELHVFADTVEDVSLFLGGQGIPYKLVDKRLRFGGDRYAELPACCFTADGVTIELVIFAPRNRKEPPLSPVDGKPMRRMGMNGLEALAKAHASTGGRFT